MLCVPLMQRRLAGGLSAGQQEAQLAPLQESCGRREQIAFVVSSHKNLFRRESSMYRHSWSPVRGIAARAGGGGGCAPFPRV